MPGEVDRQEIRPAMKTAVDTQQAHDVIRHARELLQSGKAADTMFCASAFASVSAALVEQRGYKQLKTYIVRSGTVEPILPFLTVEAALAGYVLDVEVGGYGSYMDDMLNPQGGLGRFQADPVMVVPGL